jgi:hypothetical protein
MDAIDDPVMKAASARRSAIKASRHVLAVDMVAPCFGRRQSPRWRRVSKFVTCDATARECVGLARKRTGRRNVGAFDERDCGLGRVERREMLWVGRGYESEANAADLMASGTTLDGGHGA